MKYEDIPKITREEYASMIGLNEPNLIASALLSVSYWERDWRWAQDQLLSYVDNEDSKIRYTCALGFGHLARTNGKLDVEKVEPVLKRMSATVDASPNGLIQGAAVNSLEDIEIFIYRRNN